MTDIKEIERQLQELKEQRERCSEKVAFHINSHRSESKRLKELDRNMKKLQDALDNKRCDLKVNHWYSDMLDWGDSSQIYLYIKEIHQARKHLHITSYCFFPVGDGEGSTEYKVFYFRCIYPCLKMMFGGTLPESRLGMLTKEGVPMDDLLVQAKQLYSGVEPLNVSGSFWYTMIDNCKNLNV